MSELIPGFGQFLEFLSNTQMITKMRAVLGVGRLLQDAPQSFAKVASQLALKRGLFCGFSVLLLCPLGRAQVPPGIYWHGVRQLPPSPAELDKLVKAHELWIESNGRTGTRAELSHADLSNFNLAGVNLWGANLDGAYLAGANLRNALLGIDGQKNQRISSTPGAVLFPPPGMLQGTVTGESGRIVSASQGPGPTDLRAATLSGATLAHADLSYADLSRANLTGADLSGADLSGANLSGATLGGARLDGSNLTKTNLDGTVFEPVSLSAIISPESATNLDYITYQTNPDALIKLRKRFQGEGLTTQERKITYALNRRQTQLDSGVERWFRIVAFDLTCQYGMTPGRPLRIIVVAWAVFCLLYIALLHGKRCFRVRISRHYHSKDKTREFWMWPPPSQKTSIQTRLSFERRAVSAMMFFSLVNAFNIGFREFNVGQWLRILNQREFELKAVGWVRSLAGIQSLVSIYLFALWVLTYFGRPFN